MEFKVQVQVIAIMPRESGISKAGSEWHKDVFIGQTIEERPVNIAFTSFGDKVIIPEVGSIVIVEADIESRDFTDRNGIQRWSTDIKPWRIIAADQQPAPAPTAPQPATPQPATPQAATPQAAFAPNIPVAPAQQPQYASQQPLPTEGLPF